MPAEDGKRSWESMRLTSLGKVGDVVKEGQGKLSPTGCRPRGTAKDAAV